MTSISHVRIVSESTSEMDSNNTSFSFPGHQISMLDLPKLPSKLHSMSTTELTQTDLFQTDDEESTDIESPQIQKPIIAQQDCNVISGAQIPFPFYRVGMYIEVSVDLLSTYQQNGYTVYTITVKKLSYPISQHPITKIYRRYRLFRQLFIKLKSKYPIEMSGSPQFPPKSFFSNNSEFILDRAEQLNSFCQFLVLHPVLSGTKEVQEFFSAQFL
ncbi:Phox homologous domain-containing protein [Globomyces pollinis-pini]|nr:Phox homologous domain-containing protein [Globomyces pollinis-pini]